MYAIILVLSIILSGLGLFFFVPLDVELVMFHYSILFTFLTVYLYSILALNVHAFHYVNVLLIISPRGLTIVRTSFQSLSELCKSAEFSESLS